MPKYTTGISSIKLANVANDGGPATTGLAALGYTYEDSCKLNQADPVKTDFFAEEVEDAVYSTSKKGATTLTFQIMDADTDTLVKVLGGTITTTGTAPNIKKTWNAPVTTPNIEQTVRVDPINGMGFVIPRGKVEGKLNGEFSRKGLFLIDVVVTALAPSKSGVGTIQFDEIVAA